MRAVVQRVRSARVTVGERVAGEIAGGLLVLVGVTGTDGDADVDYLARKILRLRSFEEADGKMNFALADGAGSVLVVSQFTRFGDCRRGRRPSFDAAAAPDQARTLYEALVARLRAAGTTVATGEFRARMQVASINDGPVTLLLDSEKRF